MITQDEALEVVQDQGYQVTKRTLGYWREIGQLPPLERDGQQYFWNEEVVNQIELLCQKRSFGERLSTVKVEDATFDISHVVIKRQDNTITAGLYLEDGGFLLKRLREETLNAITKI